MATLDDDKDTLVARWSCKVLPFTGEPSVCNNSAYQTKLIDTVFGDGWSAVTLIIAMAVLVGVYIGVVHLSATNRERGMSRFWGLVAAGAVILVAIIGASWITWAWSIL